MGDVNRFSRGFGGGERPTSVCDIHRFLRGSRDSEDKCSTPHLPVWSLVWAWDARVEWTLSSTESEISVAELEMLFCLVWGTGNLFRFKLPPG